MSELMCARCKAWKDPDCFQVRGRKGKRRPYCKACEPPRAPRPAPEEPVCSRVGCDTPVRKGEPICPWHIPRFDHVPPDCVPFATARPGDQL